MSQSGKLQKDVEATTANKLLVICVDRDDDCLLYTSDAADE